MPGRDEPLPLERLRRIEVRQQPVKDVRLNALSVITHFGLCISVVALPIFAALAIVKVPDRLWLFQKASAILGTAAMATLGILCVATMARVRLARPAFMVWAVLQMAWETVKLPLVLFFYAPIYKAMMTDTLNAQIAAATQPTTRPAQFDSFVNYGIYIMAVLGFLLFGGYAYAAWRTLRTPRVKAMFGVQSS